MLDIGSEVVETDADDETGQNEFNAPGVSTEADLIDAVSPAALKQSRQLTLVAYDPGIGRALRQASPLNSRQVQAAISAYSV
jgi:hypothetical protein